MKKKKIVIIFVYLSNENCNDFLFFTLKKKSVTKVGSYFSHFVLAQAIHGPYLLLYGSYIIYTI